VAIAEIGDGVIEAEEYRAGTSEEQRQNGAMRQFHEETCPNCHGQFLADEDGRRADSPGVTGFESGTLANPCRCVDSTSGSK
jgi:hypothetical protein